MGRLFGLDGTDSDPSADEYESHNALYWLCARLAGQSPIMLAVDDVHWSDATSLRFLGYLVRRLDDLPVLLALARRVDEPGADEDLLAGIAAEPLVQVIRPGPLSLDAVRELARARFETEPQDVPGPNPGSSNDLNGVAATSSTNAWAVGTFNGAIRQAIAIHCC